MQHLHLKQLKTHIRDTKRLGLSLSLTVFMCWTETARRPAALVLVVAKAGRAAKGPKWPGRHLFIVSTSPASWLEAPHPPPKGCSPENKKKRRKYEPRAEALQVTISGSYVKTERDYF